MNLFPWFLWLHIFGAIVAFGPSFAFPIIGGMGGKEPMHANFAIRVTEKIERGITIPLAIVQGITGLGLLLISGRNLTVSTNYWLGVGIVLYAIALSFAIFVQTKRVETVVHMTSTPPPPPAPGATPAGPPAALLAAVKATQQGGMILTVLIVSIVFLMVIKPGS
jgi:multidrug transporter EmrE-like cation transporter